MLVVLLSALVGCGPNCQSTCQRLYGDAPNCAIQRAGRDAEELIDYCMTQCETAMETPGDLGEYDPLVAQGQNESITIDNEKQAALWMDCISESDCSRFSDGYCAPVW